MKILFLVFYGFQEYNGISKKIGYQADALRQCGADVRVCRYEVAGDGSRKWMTDEEVLADLGKGIPAKLKKRLSFAPILRYVRREGIRCVYIRSYHNANPFTIHFVRTLKKQGVGVLLEIPTYPYDHEYASVREKAQLYTDKLFRRAFCKYVDFIVTFSDDERIFGRPTIRISNGIDFDRIPLRSPRHGTAGELNLIGVAEIHFWHGFDRLLKGLGENYSGHPEYKVRFHLVGKPSGRREAEEIAAPIRRYRLQPFVTLYGAKHGEELDALFNRADFAVGSLARHRSGIYNIKTLKNREYAARGFGFVYSETDDDFDRMPYTFKVPADDSPVSIPALIEFYQSMTVTPPEIRDSIRHLSWREQMKKVYEHIVRMKK